MLNQVFVNFYMELVFAFVKLFDFCTGVFHYDNVNKEFLEKFVTPKNVFVKLSYKDQQGIITLNYGRDYYLSAEKSEFKKSDNFDLSIINDILKENSISVCEQSPVYGYTDN